MTAISQKGIWIFAGGGTGGHIYPLLSLMEIVSEGVLLVMGRRVVEERIAKSISYPRIHLPWKRVRLDFPYLFWTFWQFFLSLMKISFLLWRIQPKGIVLSGGYISLPVAIAGRIFRVPLFLVEPNFLPGRTSRWVSRWVRKVITWRTDWVPEGIGVKKGIPVRKAFHSLPIPQGDIFTVLILGGSQGARFFNEVIPEVFPTDTLFQIIHISGEGEGERVSEKYRRRGVKARVIPYSNTIYEEFSISHLVVCRAGASTIGEVVASKRPAIFVPYPFSRDRHQEENARYLAEKGVAEVVYEDEEFSKKFPEIVRKMADKRVYEQYRENFHNLDLCTDPEVLWEFLKK
jgi:UDP-N-acetylglucosamine--N-acetylmuramyl-(pentapeptide) pyrophosphoryl-undecaprenol N-acetylglucosamine transferase